MLLFPCCSGYNPLRLGVAVGASKCGVCVTDKGRRGSEYDETITGLTITGAFITMRKKFVVSATLLLAASLTGQASAGTFDFSFAGSGVSGTVELTYGAATDAKYPQAFEVTGVSGVFSDSNNGLNIVNVPIGPLVPITHDTPEPTNLLAPERFQPVRGSGGSAGAEQWLFDVRQPVLSGRLSANCLRLPCAWRIPRYLWIDVRHWRR